VYEQCRVAANLVDLIPVARALPVVHQALAFLARNLVGDAVNVVAAWHFAWATEPAVIAVLAHHMHLLKMLCQCRDRLRDDLCDGEQLLVQVCVHLVHLPRENAQALHHVSTKQHHDLAHRVMLALNLGDVNRLFYKLLDALRARGRAVAHRFLAVLPIRQMHQGDFGFACAFVFGRWLDAYRLDRKGCILGGLVHCRHQLILGKFGFYQLLLRAHQRLTQLID